MIQAFHVYKQYDRESSALSDITLHVPKGEFCFLTGASGAGKTTFLKLVFREELPTQGQILVGGRNVTATRRPDPERAGIGVVFQDFKRSREAIPRTWPSCPDLAVREGAEAPRSGLAAGPHTDANPPKLLRAASSSGRPSSGPSSTSHAAAGREPGT
jgi:ABC-type oligopeptide transport system ATPase subunit